jgi:hypothetical protein
MFGNLSEKEELLALVARQKEKLSAQAAEAVRLHAAKETTAIADDEEKFTDVKIDKAFAVYLQANPLLMEVPGAKIIRLQDGNQVVLAVASTVLKDNSPEEQLRAERVCRIKALTSIVAEKEGVQVAHVEKLKEKTVVVLEGNKETGKSVSELLQVTEAHVKGMAKDMPPIGRWRSKDGKIYYLAIGAVCNNKGEPVREKAP